MLNYGFYLEIEVKMEADYSSKILVAITLHRIIRPDSKSHHFEDLKSYVVYKAKRLNRVSHSPEQGNTTVFHWEMHYPERHSFF
jgi:hypothetical protein